MGFDALATPGSAEWDPQNPSTNIYFVPDLTQGGTPADIRIVYSNCVAALFYANQAGVDPAPQHMNWLWWDGSYACARLDHTMPPNGRICFYGDQNYHATAFGAFSLTRAA